MKKVLSVLCVLGLLLGLVSAWAEDAASGVYVLVDVGPDGEEITLGTAALLGDQSTLITTRWAAGADNLYAVGAGGKIAITEKSILYEGSSLMALKLASPAPAEPLTLGPSAQDMNVIAMTSSGLERQAAAHVTLTGLEQDPAILYTGVPDALPGALLMNSQGELAGITAAGYGEGLDRYAAWPADIIGARMRGEGPEAVPKIQWISGLTVVVDMGEMTVDWSQLEKPETAETDALYLIWLDDGNNYVSYTQVQWEDQSSSLSYVPGRSYRVWMQQSADGEVDLEQALPAAKGTRCATEAVPPYAEHQYKDVSIYLGAAPVDDQVDAAEEVPPLETFTPESLTDENLCYYLQVRSTYQVEAQEELPLVIALTAPDGSQYLDQGGFILAPELNEGDVWNAEITQILSSCMEFTGSMAGEYSLAYYLGGQLASEFLFVIE